MEDQNNLDQQSQLDYQVQFETIQHNADIQELNQNIPSTQSEPQYNIQPKRTSARKKNENLKKKKVKLENDEEEINTKRNLNPISFDTELDHIDQVEIFNSSYLITLNGNNILPVRTDKETRIYNSAVALIKVINANIDKSKTRFDKELDEFRELLLENSLIRDQLETTILKSQAAEFWPGDTFDNFISKLGGETLLANNSTLQTLSSNIYHSIEQIKEDQFNEGDIKSIVNQVLSSKDLSVFTNQRAIQASNEVTTLKSQISELQDDLQLVKDQLYKEQKSSKHSYQELENRIKILEEQKDSRKNVNQKDIQKQLEALEQSLTEVRAQVLNNATKIELESVQKDIKLLFDKLKKTNQHITQEQLDEQILDIKKELKNKLSTFQKNSKDNQSEFSKHSQIPSKIHLRISQEKEIEQSDILSVSSFKPINFDVDQDLDDIVSFGQSLKSAKKSYKSNDIGELITNAANEGYQAATKIEIKANALKPGTFSPFQTFIYNYIKWQGGEGTYFPNHDSTRIEAITDAIDKCKNYLKLEDPIHSLNDATNPNTYIVFHLIQRDVYLTSKNIQDLACTHRNGLFCQGCGGPHAINQCNRNYALRPEANWCSLCNHQHIQRLCRNWQNRRSINSYLK